MDLLCLDQSMGENLAHTAALSRSNRQCGAAEVTTVMDSMCQLVGDLVQAKGSLSCEL